MYKPVRKSQALFDRARELIAGQTQLLSRHPTRHAFGVSPIYAERAEGCRFWDVDGNEYVDMCGGTGVIYLGYCHPVVDAAAVRSRAPSWCVTRKAAATPTRWRCG